MKTKQDAIRITNAQAARGEDIALRQRRYLISMSLRTLFFVSALIASFAGLDWLWPFLILGAIVLPYFAVVAANAGAAMSDGFRLRELEPVRPALQAKQ